ncbi:MAG: hypothetical protein WA001_03635 [Patescibacteria group bacterium]
MSATAAYQALRLRARARTSPPGTMNKLEAAWALQLEAMKQDGTLRSYAYEAITFKLAHDLRYTPDYLLIWHDGEVSLDECKGFQREKNMAKLRMAARLFPFFRFRLIRKGKRGEPTWSVEEIST